MLRLIPSNNMPVKSVIDYWQEFNKKLKDEKPEHVVDLVLIDKAEYIGLLEEKNIEEDKLFFYLVKDSRDKYIIGHCTIITKPFAETKDSNIKIAIRPSEKNKGWEDYLLGLAFNICHDIGLEDITLLCFDYYDEVLELCFQNSGATFKGFCNDERLGKCLGSLCKVRYTINLKDRANRTYDAIGDSVVLKMLRLLKKRKHQNLPKTPFYDRIQP